MALSRLVTCWRRLASNQPWLSLCSICRNLGFYSHHFNFSLKYADQQWNIWIYYVIKNESILGSIIETFYNFQMKKVIVTLKDNFDEIEKVWILFNLEIIFKDFIMSQLVYLILIQISWRDYLFSCVFRKTITFLYTPVFKLRTRLFFFVQNIRGFFICNMYKKSLGKFMQNVLTHDCCR